MADGEEKSLHGRMSLKWWGVKRREFIFATAASGVGAVVGLSAEKPADQPTRAERLVRTPLVIMAPRSDGFEAVWGVNELCKGRIEWEDEQGGKGAAAMDAFGFVPQGERVLRVRVQGLKPGHTYRVRAHTIAAADDRTEVSPWKSLRTLDPQSASTRFVVWNDTHIHNDTIQKLDDLTPKADFLMWNGDSCNNWTDESLLVPTLLHPGERDITVERPLLFTWGNHDSRGPYAYQTPSIIATPSGRPFYAFRSGPVAFICLHTGEDKPDAHPSFKGRAAFEALRAEQAIWLKSAIRQPELANAPYRVVICHIPLRWLDEHPQDYANKGFDRYAGRCREAWHATLVEWKTQLIISGHTHHHAWLPPTPTFPYGQIVGGGPLMESATWMECVANNSELRLQVHDLQGKVWHNLSLPPLT